MFEDILSKNILLAPSLNQFLLWGLKLLDSDRNLRDNREGREAMPQEWITTDYNKNLFLWKTYLFLSKCKLCWLKLPNQWHVKPETTLCDSYQVRFTIRMEVLFLLWFVVVCFFVSLFVCFWAGLGGKFILDISLLLFLSLFLQSQYSMSLYILSCGRPYDTI